MKCKSDAPEPHAQGDPRGAVVGRGLGFELSAEGAVTVPDAWWPDLDDDHACQRIAAYRAHA